MRSARLTFAPAPSVDSGSHTGAYDKYEYRNEMALVLEYLWAQPVYKATMIGFARDTSKFVRFVNMLINDSIFAMNEALTRLKTIKDTQAEMADEATWNAQPPRQRQERERTLRQDEGHAGYFMLFTNRVMGMMSYLSAEKEVALVFMLPQVRHPDPYHCPSPAVLLTFCPLLSAV